MNYFTQAALEQLGYRVEDMGEEWGSDFAGQYRWLNPSLPGDGFGPVAYSESEAWADAGVAQAQSVGDFSSSFCKVANVCQAGYGLEEAIHFLEAADWDVADAIDGLMNS